MQQIACEGGSSMAVITISRLIGSNGEEIARETAEQLHYRYVDKDLIQDIMKEYGVVEFKDVYDGKMGFWDKYYHSAEEIVQLLNEIILSVAKMGNVVIVGRGSFVCLQAYDDVIHVMVHAPLEYRLQNIMQERDFSDRAEAEHFLKRQYHIRKTFIEHNYRVKWDSIQNFDLLFNTAKITPREAVTCLQQAAVTLDATIAAGSVANTTDNIQTEMILQETVRKLL